MADHFARPLRLTRQEALAVYVRATELAATPGMPVAPALAAALAKLRDGARPGDAGRGGRHRGRRSRHGAAAARRGTRGSRGPRAAPAHLRRAEHGRAHRPGRRARRGLRQRRPLVRGGLGRRRRRRATAAGRPDRIRGADGGAASSLGGCAGRGGRCTRRAIRTSRCAFACIPPPAGSPSTTSPRIPTRVGRLGGRDAADRPDHVGSPACSCGWGPTPTSWSPQDCATRSLRKHGRRSRSTGRRLPDSG